MMAQLKVTSIGGELERSSQGLQIVVSSYPVHVPQSMISPPEPAVPTVAPQVHPVVDRVEIVQVPGTPLFRSVLTGGGIGG